MIYTGYMPDAGISDAEKIAVGLEGSVGLVSQHLLGEDLAELYALLIEAVDIPYKALEHYLVLEMSKYGSHCLRGKLISDNDA